MKNIGLLSIVLIFAITNVCFAADLDARAAFGMTPSRDLDLGLKRAQKENKRVFLVAYNPREGSAPGVDVKYFMELQETKKLVKEHFITVLLLKGHKDLQKYKPESSAERAYYVLIGKDGNTVKTNEMFANPEVGLKVVKELVALP